MSYLFLYFLLKLDSIILLFDGILTPCFILLIITGIFSLIVWTIPLVYSYEDEYGKKPDETKIKNVMAMSKGLLKAPKMIFKLILPIWLIIRILVFLLPTTKEMAVLYVVPKVIDKTISSEIPQKILNLSSEWLEELRPANIKNSIENIKKDISTNNK